MARGKKMVDSNAEKFECDFYMAWSLDDNILKKSSSGGIFTALANYVLDREGIVFGVYQNPETLILKQIPITNREDLDLVRKSKYYQSMAYPAFKKVKELLKERKWVLFSGTICQIEALLATLRGVETDTLITVDVLCHGVSSVEIFRSYVRSKKKRSKKKICKIEFRTKDIPWAGGGGTSMTHHYTDGTQDIFSNMRDTYFRAFNANLILRDSCYQCKFTNTNRKSDFTIADFWGIPDEIADKEHQEKGVGLVLVNNLRAEIIWNSLQEQVYSKKVSKELAMPFNSSLSHPPVSYPKREKFFGKYQADVDFDHLVKTCMWKEFTKLKIKDLVGEKTIDSVKKVLRKEN